MAVFWYKMIDRWVRWWTYKKRKLEKCWCPSVWESSQPSYPLSLLTFILLQGSIYWAILIRRLSKPQFGSGNVPRVYGGLRILDLVLVIAGFPFIVWNTQSFQVAILAILIQLFALIEWINYFLLRLSYSLNPLVLWKRITKGNLERSRIAKELG